VLIDPGKTKPLHAVQAMLNPIRGIRVINSLFVEEAVLGFE